jgi:acetyl-CoA carboxylase biotin carboxylase subunit
VPFVERECSLQRRHQKVIEESPSLALSPETRRRMTEAAAAVARSVGYTNAGTIEFLVDEHERFYFLEMNTRLQVEHPITEMVTGVDLVAWQIRIARGEPLTLNAEALLIPWGHAVECRVYAEDPDNGFMPSPGKIVGLRVPHGPGVRDDSGAYEGADVPIFYDPLISKLIAWGDDRGQALARMRRALAEYEVRGIRTTLPFFQWVLNDADFLAGRFDTGFIDRKLGARNGQPLREPTQEEEEIAAIAAALSHTVRAVDESSAPRAPVSKWGQLARADALRTPPRSLA